MAFIILIVLAVLLFGAGILVEGLKWAIIVGIALFILSFFTRGERGGW